jgi:ankyrin repeat protein
MKQVRLFIILIPAMLISFTTTYADDVNDQLITAGKNGDTATVKSCLAKGADVNAKNKFDQTALMMAAKNGYLQTVQILISYEANLEAKDLFGESSLHFAANCGYL